MRSGKSKLRKDKKGRRPKSMFSLSSIPMTIVSRDSMKQPMMKMMVKLRSQMEKRKEKVGSYITQVMRHTILRVKPILPMTYLSQKQTKKPMLLFSLIIGQRSNRHIFKRHTNKS